MSTAMAVPAPRDETAEAFGAGLVNLLQPRLGAAVIWASDDFFADKARLIDLAPPVFRPDHYDNNGKWMDGWESRRRRDDGHDAAVIRLGGPGRARRVDIDTSFFTGNFPPAAMLEGCVSPLDQPGDDADWSVLVPKSPLRGDSHNLFEIADPRTVTHLRLNIYPDGGIARLKVYGEVLFDWEAAGDQPIDLAALGHGGRALAWNDSHYGNPEAILAPGRGANMGDGWETRRRREPGHDWLILALGHVGRIERALVDTAHFKGNYPDRCAISGALIADGAAPDGPDIAWRELLAPQQLGPDAEHEFTLTGGGEPVSHVRLQIYPDGGISRLRLYGRPFR